jgi:hypothetical protein
MKETIFSDVTPCIETSDELTASTSMALKTEAACYSETLVNVHQCTRRASHQRKQVSFIRYVISVVDYDVSNIFAGLESREYGRRNPSR